MKDIDFDELDKAVNSLMGGIKDQSDQPRSKTLNISTTLKENEAPEYTKLEQVAQKIGSETIGGPTERTAILSEAPEDPTTTVELTSASMPETPAAQPAVPEATPVPEAPETVTPVAAEPSTESTPPASQVAPAASAPALAARRASGRFMDVMHPSSDMKTATSSVAPSAQPSREAAVLQPPERAAGSTVTPAETPTPTTSTTPEASELADSEPVSPEPLSSPFLPDAKVEKRPLGGATQADDDTWADNPSMPTDSKKDDAQLTPKMVDAADIDLPEELNNDLLAIETNVAVETPETAVGASEPSDVENNPATSEGPSSITQQYKESPSTGDQSNGAIFDVDNYHKQPAHPAKSGASWLWIVIIIVIIVVCGAGAAAFYLLGTK